MGGVVTWNHQPGSVFIGLGAQRGTVATACSESSRKGQGTAWRSLLGAPPLLVMGPTEVEANSNLTGTVEGGLDGDCGRGWDGEPQGPDARSRCQQRQTNCRHNRRWSQSKRELCTLKSVVGRNVQGEYSRQTRGACGVLRRESSRPADVVESLSLPELLVEYWESSWSSAGRPTCKETTGELSMMLLTSPQLGVGRGEV